MTRTRATLTTFALAVAVAGCGGNDPLEPPTDPRDVSFAPALNVDLDRMTRTASGLYYEDIQTGTGDQARAGSIVHVYYVGWLVDGTQFDARAAPNPPYSFTVAIGQVIQGWDEGVSGMLEGGIRKLVHMDINKITYSMDVGVLLWHIVSNRRRLCPERVHTASG